MEVLFIIIKFISPQQEIQETSAKENTNGQESILPIFMMLILMLKVVKPLK